MSSSSQDEKVPTNASNADSLNLSELGMVQKNPSIGQQNKSKTPFIGDHAACRKANTHATEDTSEKGVRMEPSKKNARSCHQNTDSSCEVESRCRNVLLQFLGLRACLSDPPRSCNSKFMEFPLLVCV